MNDVTAVRASHLLSGTILSLSAVIGALVLLSPFLAPAIVPDGAATLLEGSGQSSLLTIVLLGLVLAVLLLEMQGQAIGAKTVAALGVLVAAAAVLRFIEVAIPGPGGFSPVFVPIILGGYVFGARFGFLMGALTLLVSALLTGGVGPWLPFQMLAAAWVGLTAGWLPHPQGKYRETALLASFGFMWGFLYGFILNLYFWPFMTLAAQADGDAGLLSRYLAFYVTTSLVWDLGRAGGNLLLLAYVGIPTIKALQRFDLRLHFEEEPA
jgi:energy-coupling factor transport system substrate-specific component